MASSNTWTPGELRVSAELRAWQPSKDLVWTNFDDSDQWVVYNNASADLHLITASARRLWTLAGDGQPHSPLDLATVLASEAGRPVDTEMLDITRAALEFMDDAGLLIPLSV